MGRKHERPEREIVVKSVWWRQLGLTLFLLLLGVFFAFIGYVGIVVSWFGTVLIGLVTALSLLDQVFGWSRLRIDDKGYSLRGWFRRVELRRDEVEEFVLRQYLNRQLILVLLTEQAARERSLEDRLLPFPCAFGRPVEEIFETLKKSLERR